MADNVVITAGTGTTVHADEYTHGTLGSGKTQLMKLVDGTLDSGTPIGVPDIGAKVNAIRVCPANDITDGTYIGDIKFGEALPAGTAAIGKLAANSGVDIGDVDILSIAAGDNNIGNVDIVTVPAPLNVVGGGTEATALRVTIANDSTGVVSVDDGGGTLTVDGTITANLSATDNAVLDTIDAVLDTINAKLVTGTVIGDVNLGATDNAVLDAIDTVLDLINAKLVTGTVIGDVNLGATDNAVLDTIAGDTTSLDTKVTACNTGAVVISSGTVTTVSTVTNISQFGGAAINMGEGTIDTGTQRVTLATDDDGVAHLATIAGDTTNIETAIQIIDDWDSTHDSAASADGPQMMAAYDATKPTAVGDGDAVRVLADEYGRLLAGVEKTAWQEDYDSADASGEGEVVKASAASTIVVVQSYIISVDAEMWVKLQDEDSNALTGKFWLKAGGGVAITLPDKAPLILGVDKDLEVISEGAGNISVSATGYTIPG